MNLAFYLNSIPLTAQELIFCVLKHLDFFVLETCDFTFRFTIYDKIIDMIQFAQNRQYALILRWNNLREFGRQIIWAVEINLMVPLIVRIL